MWSIKFCWKCLWIFLQTCSSEFLLPSSSSSSSPSSSADRLAAGCDAMKPADISDALKDSLASLWHFGSHLPPPQHGELSRKKEGERKRNMDVDIHFAQLSFCETFSLRNETTLRPWWICVWQSCSVVCSFLCIVLNFLFRCLVIIWCGLQLDVLLVFYLFFIIYLYIYLFYLFICCDLVSFCLMETKIRTNFVTDQTPLLFLPSPVCVLAPDNSSHCALEDVSFLCVWHQLFLFFCFCFFF